MSSTEQTVLITGATGFLGRSACAAFTAAGFQVRALVRNPAAAADLRPIAQGGIFRCDLPDVIDERALAGGARALIHAAYETRFASAEQARRTNVKGTEALVRLGRGSGVRQLVFVSSMAAHENAASLYGKTKYELEKLFDRTADTVIKPATIVGAGGVFQRTREMLRRLPVLRCFADRRLQTIWIEDVARVWCEASSAPLGGTLRWPIPKVRRCANSIGRSPRWMESG
jgi:NADH dehydrogenase